VNTDSNLVSYWGALAPDWPGGFWWHWLVFTVIVLAYVLLVVLAYVYIERRFMGRMQARIGPNRAGPFGILQTLADAMKLMLKEDIVPARADRVVHWLAPIVALVPVLMVFAVVPFQDGALLTDLNIGILYVVAVGSMTSVGIMMAGWGSNNKYSLLGAMRDIAAVVSYEIPLVLSIIGVVLLAGSLSLTRIVMAQDIPFILLQPLGFLLFFTAACAEINRSPFDLLEADSELTAGFHTEYSGMKFALFFLAEYGEALVVSSIIATLFLGGWRGPVLPPWLWFLGKVVVVFLVMVWTRTTLPRVRIDQLMALAWKFLFPLALINLFVTALEVLFWPQALPYVMILINIVIFIVLVPVWSKFFKLGWGKVEVRTVR
jgi:NADH-quinone oxidoreductase subunit H